MEAMDKKLFDDAETAVPNIRLRSGNLLVVAVGGTATTAFYVNALLAFIGALTVISKCADAVIFLLR